jgi:hypothetical protein
VFAVLRVEEGGGRIEDAVTVKKILRSQELAMAEVERLNALNASKGARYFWQVSRLFNEGMSAGTSEEDRSRPAV